MGLPVSRRLRATSDFADVRAGGTSFPARFVVLSVLPLKDEGVSSPWRCGLITTRKIGCAVQRNRIRRLLREIVRASPIRPGVHFVIIGRWRAAEASFAEMKEDWLRVAKRARLLEPTPVKKEGEL